MKKYLSNTVLGNRKVSVLRSFDQEGESKGTLWKGASQTWRIHGSAQDFRQVNSIPSKSSSKELPSRGVSCTGGCRRVCSCAIVRCVSYDADALAPSAFGSDKRKPDDGTSPDRNRLKSLEGPLPRPIRHRNVPLTHSRDLR